MVRRSDEGDIIIYRMHEYLSRYVKVLSWSSIKLLSEQYLFSLPSRSEETVPLEDDPFLLFRDNKCRCEIPEASPCHKELELRSLTTYLLLAVSRSAHRGRLFLGRSFFSVYLLFYIGFQSRVSTGSKINSKSP